MGGTFDALNDDLVSWLGAQRVFFIATAPSGAGGHVNCSPKGGDAFRVLGPTTVAYADLTGSGVETIAHVKDNGRVVLMFCAFEGRPRIVRLHGRGEVLRSDHEEFVGLLQRFGRKSLGVRAIVRVECARISESCGFGVPRYDFVAERETLDEWAEKKGHDGVADYWRQKNASSLDGLPGV